MRPLDPNPRRAQKGWPPVVVAGAYLTGVRLMRNLTRRGLTACCIDHDRRQHGFRTVYGQAFECPNPDNEPNGWLSFMEDLARKLGGRPVLIASADQFVSAIARHAGSLKPHFNFCHSAVALQASLATKEKQYELAGSHGLPVPRTEMARSFDEVMAFAATARFPCVLKPIHFRLWEHFPAGHPFLNRKVAVASSARELEKNYRRAAGITPEVMIQEIIEGPDTAKLVYLSCYPRSGGARLGSCIVRELRTCPIHFGSATVVEPVSDAETDALCDGFLRRIGYGGLCEIELKRDSRDGCLKMIEANPRYSGTGDAAPYAGVDLGWLHYLDLIGEPVAEVTTSRPNFRHIVLERDFATLGSYWRAGLLSVPALLRSYRPPLAFFDFDLRDWRLTARTAANLARIALRPLYRRLFPGRRL